MKALFEEEASNMLACKAEYPYITESNLQVYYYKPLSLKREADVLVSIHGISRKPLQHLQLLRYYADTTGTLIVAPYFDRRNFRYFQTLGYRKSRRRADLSLLHALDTLSTRLNISTDNFRLFGYSGGAQFSHRFAMLYPQRISELLLGAAGWYSFPEPELAFPYGISGLTETFGADCNMKQFLNIPTTVFVGSEDNDRDSSLNVSTTIDRHQGKHRLERARRWVDAMQFAAYQNDLTSRIKLEIIPGCKHSVSSIVASDAFTNCLKQNHNQ